MLMKSKKNGEGVTEEGYVKGRVVEKDDGVERGVEKGRSVKRRDVKGGDRRGRGV